MKLISIFGVATTALLALSSAAWGQGAVVPSKSSVVLLCVPGISWDQACSSAVTSKLIANRVDTVDGKIVLKPATQVKPGDTVEYSAVYSNPGENAADRLQATLPIPAGTVLLPDSAKPAANQASIDGVNFAPVPLKRRVQLANGSYQEELTPLPDYRALRWEVGTIAPGKEATVSMRVRINSPVELVPAK
jgi:uncharacterized repeat protein (TIGR01451 family)